MHTTYTHMHTITHTHTHTHMHTADSSSSSLSSIGDVEVSPPLEEGLLDDSFAKDAPSYDVPVKQKKMSRNVGRKQAVRALCLFVFFYFS